MASAADRVARRFLHVCLNIGDFGQSHQFYGEALGLRLAMQTDPVYIDASVLGYTDPTRSQASFMYDWRGPRSSCALELVQWFDPPTQGKPYVDVSTPGLHAVALGVASVERAEKQITSAGGAAVSQRGRSTFGAGDTAAIIASDPDGATLEVVAGEFAATTVLGLRATCSNLDSSVSFYQTLGFEVVNEPNSGEFVWGNGKVATLTLPEDEGGFVLCLGQPDAVTGDGRSYPFAHHNGFFRMALRVEDSHDTYRLLNADGLNPRGPFPIDLGGTPVNGLQIGTVADPDGVLVEFVDRPKTFFRPPPTSPTRH